MIELQLNKLQEFVKNNVALRTINRLQPAGGSNSKVFPPTYQGGIYAVEYRLIDGKKSKCVLLDSVASQANRMEETLQDDVDRKNIKIPITKIDFSKQPNLDIIGSKITSLQTPHRIVDALFRECYLEDTPFRDSSLGKEITNAATYYATPLFEVCPTALLFGMWDSTGPKGGMGNKFERAITSEIVGINAIFGVGTVSRIDPLVSKTEGITVYRKEDGNHTLDEKEAKKNTRGKPSKYGKGKLSNINIGNVTPALSNYDEKTKGINQLTGEPIENDQTAARGATIEYAEHICVISLAALRKLHFPVGPNEPSTPQRDDAARTVLASLGLLAATRMINRGLDLRSGCLLVQNEPVSWQVPGNTEEKFTIDDQNALNLLKESVESASGQGISWKEEEVVLTPNENLIKIIENSQSTSKNESSDEG